MFTVPSTFDNNIALSLASAMNQATQINTQALSDNDSDLTERSSSEDEDKMEVDNQKIPQSFPAFGAGFRHKSLVLITFLWQTALPMALLPLSDTFTSEHFAFVSQLSMVFFFYCLTHMLCISKSG